MAIDETPPGETPLLPQVVNLLAAADDTEYELTVKKTTAETRTAILEDGRAERTEKAKKSNNKRLRDWIVLGVLIAFLFLCVYEIFFATANPERIKDAKTGAAAVIAYLAGNFTPKLFQEGEDKKKE